MAVYERKYRAYEGAKTPAWSRFLVLPRYAYEAVFASKLFVAFLVAAMIPTLVYGLLIYLPHNLGFLKSLQVDPAMIERFFGGYDGAFFLGFMYYQKAFAFILTFILAPALVSSDLRSNGLPLYLSRPFSRVEYVLGKMAVLLLLLSGITWIPGMFLYLLQSFLGGFDWFKQYYWIGGSIFLSSWIWILVLCLVSLALSAYVRWKQLARLMLLIVFIVLTAFGEITAAILRSDWGNVFNLSHMVFNVWQSLFRIEQRAVDLPAIVPWLSIAAFCAFFLGLLNRKLRAYEVVR